MPAPTAIVERTLTNLPNGITSFGELVLTERTGGAQGDGVTDDTAALQSVLTAGESIVGRPGATYLITSALNITTAKTGIEGNGATFIMSTAAGHFDNAVTVGRYGADAVGIRCIGTSGARIDKPFVRNMVLRTSAWVDDRYLKGIYFKYTKDLEISGCDISGFSRGRGLITLNNVDYGEIVGNTLRDSYSNSTAPLAGTDDPQITGIESDNDADPLVDENGDRYSSRGVIIRGNSIRNLTFGSASLGAGLGYQTDGINLNGPGKNTAANSKPTRGFVVSGNYIYNVGEGVDCFGYGNVITNNHIRRAFNSGCKFIHGASGNLCADNIIEDTGDLGIVFASSSSSDVTPADGNVARGNIIRRINQMVDWYNVDGTKSFDSVGGTVAPNASGSCGIHVVVTTAHGSQVTNLLMDANYIDCDSGSSTLGIFIENNTGGSATHIAQHNIILNPAVAADAYRDVQGYMSVRLPPRSTAVTETAATHTLAGTTETLIANRAGTITVTMGVARKNRRVYIKTITANTVVSAASDVIPLIGGAAGTDILAATAGKWAILEGNGTNWEIMAAG